MRLHKNRCERSLSFTWLIFFWGVLLLGSCAGSKNRPDAEPAATTFRGGSDRADLTRQGGESGFEFQLRKLINEYRRDNGLAALKFDSHLHRLAKEHSKNMGRVKKLSHEGFHERFQRSGYSLAVENVAYNYTVAREQFEGWQKSPGHNRNLLHPEISHVGISQVGAYVTFFACGN